MGPTHLKELLSLYKPLSRNQAMLSNETDHEGPEECNQMMSLLTHTGEEASACLLPKIHFENTFKASGITHQRR